MSLCLPDYLFGAGEEYDMKWQNWLQNLTVKNRKQKDKKVKIQARGDSKSFPSKMKSQELEDSET